MRKKKIHDNNSSSIEGVTTNRSSDEVRKISRSMKYVPSALQLKGHATEKHITKANLLFWEISGRGNFSELPTILMNKKNSKKNNNDRYENSVRLIEDEMLLEKLSDLDSAKIINKFQSVMGNKQKLITCGSCGERSYDKHIR